MAILERLAQHKSRASLLTARELQIVALVAEGSMNNQIASRLGISEWIVSTHLRRIFSKLAVDSPQAVPRRSRSA
jgi:DNA-binding NarL/FixJ family response regulator